MLEFSLSNILGGHSTHHQRYEIFENCLVKPLHCQNYPLCLIDVQIFLGVQALSVDMGTFLLNVKYSTTKYFLNFEVIDTTLIYFYDFNLFFTFNLLSRHN